MKTGLLFPLRSPEYTNRHLNELSQTFDISRILHKRINNEHYIVSQCTKRLNLPSVHTNITATEIALNVTNSDQPEGLELPGLLFDFFVYRKKQNKHIEAIAHIITKSVVNYPTPNQYYAQINKISSGEYNQLANQSIAQPFIRPFKFGGVKYSYSIMDGEVNDS